MGITLSMLLGSYLSDQRRDKRNARLQHNRLVQLKKIDNALTPEPNSTALSIRINHIEQRLNKLENLKIIKRQLKISRRKRK